VVLVDGRRRFPGSGVVFGPELILTAGHVVERDEDLHVQLPNGETHDATLVGRDLGLDLALLKVPGAALSPLDSSIRPLQVGELVITVARPASGSFQATLGMVSAQGSQLRTGRGAILDSYALVDMVSYPGFSGGAVIDSHGRLVGLNTSALTRGRPLVLPVSVIWPLAQGLAEHGQTPRGYLGIRTQAIELAAAQRQALQRDQATALLIVGVDADTPAAAAGLMPGDVLVSLAEQPLQDADDLVAALSRGLAGQSTTAAVLRGGSLSQVSIEIGTRPTR
jgi:S1-C subfamily serine protease